MNALKGACIGAGYFSQFHLDAWTRIPEVDLVAICDLDESRARQAAEAYGVPEVYTDVREMLAARELDFADVITPPATHETLCRALAEAGVHVICQKPLAPTCEDAERMVEQVDAHGVRFMVHENFRFQPWHREIKKLLDEGAIGQVHSLTFRSRTGDGWGDEAYLGRQPYFRTMPRLLIYETGVHFIDTFRYLAGEVRQVYAVLRRLNPVIAGEDCGLMVLTHDNGAVAMWDANRYNASTAEDPRYTFGAFLVEGAEGTLRLYEDGRLTIQALGAGEVEHPYTHERRGFGGDCVYNTQRHFVESLLEEAPFETDARDYLQVLRIQDAVYAAAESGRPVSLVP